MCGENFASMTTYAYHQRRRHGGAPDKLHHCPHCDGTFLEKKALSRHRNEVHSKLSSFPEVAKCPFCWLLLQEGAQDLTEHEKLHEAKAAEKLPYGCVLCDSRVFTNSLDLKSHVKHAHNPSAKGPKCDKCQKVSKFQWFPPTFSSNAYF